MSNPVFSSLLPVVLLIATGFIAGRVGWIRAEATKDLANLVFMVLTPALLFRAMSSVRVEHLNFRPVAMYFVAAGLLYAIVFLLQGRGTHAAVVALAASFSNTVMIGVALVGLAYGDAGLVMLFTLISVHALVLLTAATVVLELVAAREAASRGRAAGTEPRHALLTIASAVKNGVIHPVPLPIILGLAFAQTGWVIPPVVDRPLQLLGSAFGPIALLLVGATLTQVRVGPYLKDALMVTALKNLALPALVGCLCYLSGLRGLDLNVMVVAASLPMGANVFMFAQRYEVAQELVTASLAVSTVCGLLTISLIMAILPHPSFG